MSRPALAPAAVSRSLRDLGFKALPSGTPRTREGIRVSGRSFGYVGIVVGLDDEARAEDMAQEIADAINRGTVGLAADVSPNFPNQIQVRRA